ncbi:MAG TPA: OmpA family protein, partial [Gammaproteobacteria bacterium]|nr:OmpA family protein [Gammaproteobacteria bacterium]
FRDLDADNDGIRDVIENAGSDPDDDGVIGTGVPSVNASGIPAGGGLLPRDVNNNGIPDYREYGDTSPLVMIRTGLKGIGAIDSWSLLLLLPVLLLVRVANKKYWLLVVLIPGMASAENDDEYNRRVYVGAGVGLSIMAPETGGTGYVVDEDQDLGYRIYAGYDWNSALSVDISLASLGTTTLQPTGEIDYAINSASVLFYFYDEGENDHLGWAAYIKGGLGSIQNDANVPYERVNSLQIAYGIGAEYGWENGVAARVDFETYDEDASLLTAGLLYRFGGEKKPVVVAPAPEPEPIPQDDDLDGVLNAQDACPGTAQGTVVDARGCGPEPDSDGDGVSDSKDQCPGTEAHRKVDDRGCEFDKDGDGVVNAIDECPNTLAGATVNAVGCAVFETRIEGVNFKTASAQLTDNAKAILDTVAKVLVSIPGVRIQVEAHTDNVGREKDNQTLSEARAQSVKEYLSVKGVTEDRLVAVGFGEGRPVDDNNTEAGRAKNRRVEFSVITDTSR